MKPQSVSPEERERDRRRYDGQCAPGRHGVTEDGGSLEKTRLSEADDCCATLTGDSPVGMRARTSRTQGCAWCPGSFTRVERALSPLKGGCALFC